MTKYHINPETGIPNICRATKRACTFGGEGEHYDSKESARSAYEQSQDVFTENDKKFKGMSAEKIFALLERSTDKALAMSAAHALIDDKIKVNDIVNRAKFAFYADGDVVQLGEIIDSLKPQIVALRRAEERIANILQTGYAGDYSTWSDTFVTPISRAYVMDRFNTAKTAVVLSYESRFNGVITPSYNSRLVGASREVIAKKNSVSFVNKDGDHSLLDFKVGDKTFVDDNGNCIVESYLDGDLATRLIYRLYS